MILVAGPILAPYLEESATRKCGNYGLPSRVARRCAIRCSVVAAAGRPLLISTASGCYVCRLPHRTCWGRLLATLGVCFVARAAVGQELEPRAYRTIPVGLNFALLGLSYSNGNVLTDPTLPIQDLELRLRTSSVSYLRSLGILGRSASILATIPYSSFSGTATLDGEPISGSRSGFADSRVRLTINLVGGPALTPAKFRAYRQRRNLGASLTLVAPTGQYDASRLINFGSNRWSFKPELGYSSIRGRWIFEGALGLWFFTDNTDFFGGAVREQDPLGSIQAHISYNFRPTLWLAIDGNFFTGGGTTIDKSDSDDLQRSSRVGVTVSLPLRKRQSIKISAQTGAYTRIGADFDVLTVSYLVQWGGARNR